MSEKNKTDQYVEYINKHILPFIDYSKLQDSYNIDMAYAKGVLTRLHEAMVEVYGSDRLNEFDGDEGFVVIPGAVQGKESKNVAIALLDLDLSSSGEHWGTSFLCHYGVVSQSGDMKDPERESVMKEIGSYDYCYTAAISGDIHVDNNRLPEELKDILSDFRNHRAVFQNEREEKPSVLDKIREAEKAQKEPKKDKPSQKKTGPEL